MFFFFFFLSQNFRSANLPPLFSNMEIFTGGFLRALAVGKAKGLHTAADWVETSGIPAERLSPRSTADLGSHLQKGVLIMYDQKGEEWLFYVSRKPGCSRDSVTASAG